jgi:cytochrome P450
MAESRHRPPKMFDTSLRMRADGPAGVPLVNNVRFLATAHDYAMRAMAPFHDQPVVPVTRGNGSMVVAMGPDAVRQVFTDNATFHRAGEGILDLPAGHPWSKMFQAVITANGDEHRRRRRLLMPVVHKTAMDHYREIFHETYERSRFARTADETPFDLVDELLRMSKTNLLRGMLGVTDSPANHRLADDILALTQAVFRPQVLLLRWNTPYTPYGRWVGRVASAYQRLAVLIEERRSQPSRPDALSIVCNSTDSNGDELSTEEIAGELHSFFSAGFETTAMTMTWALLTMLAAPSDLDCADETAVDAIVKESQRLLPAVPITLPRRVTADVSIAGSAPVPAGALIFLASVVEHHNPRTYAQPHRFRPQRWLDPHLAPGPSGFFPFGVGARRCLGAAFADLQARVTVGRIGANERPLRLLTTKVDYRMKSGVVSAPRRPVMVQFAPPGATWGGRGHVTVTGSVNRLWHGA